MRRPALIIALAVCLGTPLLRAQQPGIRALTAQPRERALAARVQLEHLFPPRIASTIRSGLPAIVRCDFRVTEVSGREVARALHSLQVTYDLWAQRYHLLLPDSGRFVTSFQEMEQVFGDFVIAEIVPRARLDSTATYRLRLRVAVIPITAQQSRQWLQRLESEEPNSAPSAAESGRSGFSLNVSRLLSFFLSGEEQAHGTSAWASSPPFRLERQP